MDRGSRTRRWSPGRAGATALGALAVIALLPGCGNSPPEKPKLVRESTLSIALATGPGSGPEGFQEELLTDLATRLDLNFVSTPAAPGAGIAAPLVAHRADAAAPVPIRRLTAGALSYSAPYYEDPVTGTLYGLAVLAGADAREDTPLLEDLDEALSEITDDGTLQELYDKWQPGTDVPDRVLNDATD